MFGIYVDDYVCVCVCIYVLYVWLFDIRESGERFEINKGFSVDEAKKKAFTAKYLLITIYLLTKINSYALNMSAKSEENTILNSSNQTKTKKKQF